MLYAWGYVTNKARRTRFGGMPVLRCTLPIEPRLSPNQLELYPWLPAGFLAFKFPQAGQLVAFCIELTDEAHAVSGNAPAFPFSSTSNTSDVP